MSLDEEKINTSLNGDQHLDEASSVVDISTIPLLEQSLFRRLARLIRQQEQKHEILKAELAKVTAKLTDMLTKLADETAKLKDKSKYLVFVFVKKCDIAMSLYDDISKLTLSVWFLFDFFFLYPFRSCLDGWISFNRQYVDYNSFIQ